MKLRRQPVAATVTHCLNCTTAPNSSGGPYLVISVLRLCICIIFLGVPQGDGGKGGGLGVASLAVPGWKGSQGRRSWHDQKLP